MVVGTRLKLIECFYKYLRRNIKVIQYDFIYNFVFVCYITPTVIPLIPTIDKSILYYYYLYSTAHNIMYIA